MSAIIDTPDYQRGVVSAQQLLATVARAVPATVVGVPPNAETLIVTTIVAPGGIHPTVQGNMSGSFYTGIKIPAQPFGAEPATWYFDISQAIDDTVTVNWTAGPPNTWYVYSDGAAHIVADASKISDQRGVAFTLPTLPSLSAGDHPPVEANLKAVTLGGNSTILPAPGAQFRYRVFGVQMAAAAGGLVGYVNDAVTGTALCVCAGPGNASSALPAQGVPLSINAAIGYAQSSGPGSMLIVVAYTLEFV